MKDLDKDFIENNTDTFDSNDKKDLFEESNNVQDNKDLKESTQENKEELFEEIEDNAQEGKDTFEKEEAAYQKSEDSSEKAGTDKEEVRPNGAVNEEYSSCYTPPYYVPNFTVNREHSQDGDNSDARRKGCAKAFKVAFASLGIAIGVFAAFILGVLSGNLQPTSENNPANNLDLKGEEIVVIKNSPQMNIVQNPDADYVPKNLPEVVQKVGNSVVEISTSSVVTDRFYGQYVTSGAGSGVIIAQNDVAGYIITNQHVVDSAEEITVRLTSKDEYSATLINANKSLDLAILRIVKKSNEEFTVAPIGDSSKLIVGQDIVAIGNPLGSLGGTVTDGIISALDRNVNIEGVSMTLLQHNAAINPGNSGGALFDMMGNLVGVVNAKTSESGIEGLGFAIPVNIAFEYFRGVMQAASIGASVDYGRNNEHIYGVYVVNAYENSAFEYLDRIIKINGAEIKTLDDFYSQIIEFEAGDTLEITVVRDKAEKTLNIKIQ